MSDSSSSEEGDDSWISWFCALEGHEMFCEVERGYIEDGFNLYGLRHWVPSINDSLDVILDRVSQNDASHELMEATCALYGLIHARYVLTTSGLEAMYAKYTLQEFGNCPHFLCRGQPVVPLGVRDEPHMETVKLYCPKCQDIYVHPSRAAQRVDGAYFGTTFPHLFFMTYGNMIPEPPDQRFVPRVFGFRVHSSAANGAFARGNGQHHEQHLQERRRLRVPAAAASAASVAGPRQGPARIPSASGSASIDLSGVVGAGSASGKGAAVAGTVTEEAGGQGAGEGRGEAMPPVRITAEEGWREGKGADGNRAGGLASGAAAAGGRGDTRRDKAGDKNKRSAGVCRRGAMENGGQASATSKHPRGSGGRGTTAGLEAKDGEDNGEPENDALHNGSTAQRFDRGKVAVKNNGGISINGESKAKGSDRGRNSGAVAVARDAVDADSKALNTSRAADNGRAQKHGNEAGASGGRSRNGNGNGGKGATAEAENGAAGPASRSGGGGGRGKGERLSTSQERGKKRSPEAELETAAEAPEDAGGGGGGDGAGGRARGKVPRGRHSTSARSAASATSTSPTMAVEGSSSGRRTRGTSLA